MYRMIVVVLFLSLISCKEKLTDSYLMTHPQALKQELKRCEETNAQDETCQIILNAATHFSDIVNEQQSDPEKFGQKILDDEIQLVQIEKNLNETKKLLVELKKTHVSSNELQNAEEKINQLEKDLVTQKEQLDISLAVVGMNTPE